MHIKSPFAGLYPALRKTLIQGRLMQTHIMMQRTKIPLDPRPIGSSIFCNGSSMPRSVSSITVSFQNRKIDFSADCLQKTVSLPPPDFEHPPAAPTPAPVGPQGVGERLAFLRPSRDHSAANASHDPGPLYAEIRAVNNRPAGMNRLLPFGPPKGQTKRLNVLHLSCFCMVKNTMRSIGI